MRQLPRRLVIDLVIAATLLAGSGVWATRFWNAWTAHGGQPSFYQDQFEPAVMVACGKGYLVAENVHPQILTDFLQLRRDAMSCSDLPAALQVGRRGLSQEPWFYLETTVGLAWRIVGISWSRLAPLFGLLFGVTIAVAYGIFRLGMGRFAALACAVALAISSAQLDNLPHLRDYAKAPFTLAFVLILGLLVTRPVRRGLLLMLAFACGVVLGVGYGFRTDFLINLPIFVVVMFLFLDGGVTRHLALKAAAAAVFVATFVAVSWPVTSSVLRQGGCQWHVALLGLQSPFDEYLHVAPGPYEFGYAYADGYVVANVQGFAHRTDPTAGSVTYCSHEYDVQSGRYFRAYLTAFPADMIARAYASVLQIADLPFRAWASPLGGWYRSLYDLRATVLRPKIGWGAGLSAVTLLVTAGASTRLGLFLLFFLAYFGGYPAIQFQERHHFHLEFMGWWAAGFLAHQALVTAREILRGSAVREPLARGARRAVVFSAAAVVAVVGVLVGARWYQRHEATALFASYIAAPKVPLEPPDGALSGIVPAVWPQYLEVDFDQARCGPNPAVTFRHDPRAAGGDLSKTVTLSHRSRTPGITRVLQPVMSSYQRLEISDAAPGCVAGTFRVADLHSLPLLLGVTLPPDWHTLPLHERLVDWEADPWVPRFVALPKSPWTAASGARLMLNRWGALNVIGDRSAGGYQITSGVVPVPAGSRVMVRAKLTTWHGRVCLGALDGTALKWLTPASWVREEMSFSVDASGGFRVAIVNCNAGPTRLPSVFSVASPAYAIE